MKRLASIIDAAWPLLALAFVLVWWPALGQAQTAQTPRPFALPKCMPAALGGPGAGFATIDGPDGTCHGWWCPDATAASGWRQWQHCRIPGYGWGSLASATAQLAATPLTLESLQDCLQRNQQAPTSAGVPFYNALHSKMDVAMAATKPAPPPPPPPPAPAWVVDAATAADGTRPAYALANGVRGSVVVARALAGQPCKPEVAQSPSSVAGKVFAAYGPNFSAALVALCRRP